MQHLHVLESLKELAGYACILSPRFQLGQDNALLRDELIAKSDVPLRLGQPQFQLVSIHRWMLPPKVDEGERHW